MNAADTPFELKTSGTAGYLDSYLPSGTNGYRTIDANTTDTLTTADGAKIEWLVTKSFNAKNYNDTSDPDFKVEDDIGIRPGDSGVLRFWIVPKGQRTMSFKFHIDITPYKKQYPIDATTGKPNYDANPTAVVLTASDTELSNFIDCHVLFFRGYNSTTKKYSNLIDDEVTETITFTDENKDGILDDYPIDIYWVWPETLGEAVLTDSASRTAICQTTSTTSGEGESAVTTYSNELLTKFNGNPGGFLKGYSFPSGTTALTQADIESSYGPLSIRYNNADQEIGDNIMYLITEMTVSLVE